jgi:hypothetical protein
MEDISMRMKILMGILIILVVVAVVTKEPPKPVSPADSARDARLTDEFATKTLSEKAIRSMLKDPASGVFTESEGRVKDRMHVACGYVNSKNSFGAMAGASPWLVVVETKTAMIATGENVGKFNLLWNKYCVGSEDGEQPRRSPPDSFRGIKWGSALPSVQKLRWTALNSCAAVVEQKNFTDTPPCTKSPTWQNFMRP